jgi:peptide/nickel transport system substrate-binding protein
LRPFWLLNVFNRKDGGRKVKQYRISKKEMEKTHPVIPEAYNQLEQGRISRREFLRLSTLLGLSAGVASVAAACGAGEEPAAPAGEEMAGDIVRGGTFTRAMELQQIDHPGRFSWIQQSNVVSQVAEYLTQTGPDNITRPYLLEKWEANEDVNEWTLYLREGVKFNNGDELTTEMSGSILNNGWIRI